MSETHASVVVSNTREAPPRELPVSSPVTAPFIRPVCFQKEKRDAEAKIDPRSPDTTLDYVIEKIEAEEAEAFIKRYEWLNTASAPGRLRARYGARNRDGELAAVALFGKQMVQSTALCRKIDTLYLKKHGTLHPDDAVYVDTVICLERGACAHWAHPHTASWFIPRVLKLAHQEYGWKIFYAYSDMSAGEIGTIYQACNWLYIGLGSGRKKAGGAERERWHFKHMDDPRPDFPISNWMTSRSFYKRKHPTKDRRLKKNEDVGELNGQPVDGGLSKDRPWRMLHVNPKHRYVQFVTDDKRERRELVRALRFKVLEYPKRPLTEN